MWCGISETPPPSHHRAIMRKNHIFVRREKALCFSGCDSRPAIKYVPAPALAAHAIPEPSGQCAGGGRAGLGGLGIGGFVQVAGDGGEGLADFAGGDFEVGVGLLDEVECELSGAGDEARPRGRACRG